MGDFRNLVVQDDNWWEDIDSLESAFHRYTISDIEAQTEALRTSPDDSQERGFYHYVLGKDVVGRKKTATELGTVATLLAQARRDVAQVKTYNLAAHLEQKQLRTKMEELLGLLDHYAGQLHGQGALKIKRSMIETVLRGEWTAPVDNSLPAKAGEMCNPYNLKHFGGDKKAARYLGDCADRYLVKAMEEKAKDHGLLVPGAMVFRFNANVGWDSESGDSTTANTTTIRVDSIGSSQHSHPLAERGSTHASFHTYVVKEIISAAAKSSLDRLVEIAKFLTICGGAIGEFKPPSKLKTEWAKAQADGMTLPACKFW